MRTTQLKTDAYYRRNHKANNSSFISLVYEKSFVKPTTRQYIKNKTLIVSVISSPPVNYQEA